jgi:plastocyanin
VMGADLAFEDSNLLRTDESFSRTLTEPGTYTYICGPHQYMIGTITVT